MMTVKTERLTARRVAADDWESMQKIWEDQKNSAYACYDKPNDTNPEAVKKRIERWAAFEKSTEHMFYAVCLEDTVIGCAAFNQRPNGYEIGYCFRQEYHGRGYARESISALIAAVKSMQPGAVISAGTALKNTPSVKLLQALGFSLKGTEKVSFYKDAEGNDIWFEGGIFEL